MDIPSTVPTSEQYVAARARIEQRLWIVVHVIAYVSVNVGLALSFGLRPEAGYVWGWGIGLAVHGIYVVADGTGLFDRLVQREMERHP